MFVHTLAKHSFFSCARVLAVPALTRKQSELFMRGAIVWPSHNPVHRLGTKNTVQQRQPDGSKLAPTRAPDSDRDSGTRRRLKYTMPAH